MAFIETIQKASFVGIEFPWMEIDITGSLRHFVHTYLRSPGGDVETLKRNLYEISITIPAHETLRNWPDILDRLQEIIELCEFGEAGQLVVPTIGTINAVATKWNKKLVARIKSGFSAFSLSFLEDQRSAFLSDDVVFFSRDKLPEQLAPFLIAMGDSGIPRSIPAAINDPSGIPSDPIGDIIDAVNGVLAIKDQFDLASNLIDAKLQSLIDLCERVNDTIPGFNQPDNYAALEALHALWFGAVQAKKDVQQKLAPINTFTTDRTMTISEASMAIYGDSSKAVDLLKINSLPKPLSIQPGTDIRFYIG